MDLSVVLYPASTGNQYWYNLNEEFIHVNLLHRTGLGIPDELSGISSVFCIAGDVQVDCN